jgi:hypothetical protein
MKPTLILALLALLLGACAGGEEDRAWNAAVQANSPQALDSFLLQYPNSSYRKQALSKKEDYLWSRAELEKTEYFYKKYAADYPQGAHTEEVNAKIAALSIPTLDLAKLTEAMFIGKIDYGSKQIQVLSMKFVRIEQNDAKIDFIATLNTKDFRTDIAGSIEPSKATVLFEEDPNAQTQLGLKQGRLYQNNSGKWFMESTDAQIYWIIRQN